MFRKAVYLESQVIRRERVALGDIPFFEDTLHALGVVGPHSRQEIRLQLKTDLDLVEFALAHPLPQRHDLRATVEGKVVTLEGQADSLDAKGRIMAEFNRMVNTENTVNRIRDLERQAAPSVPPPAPQKTEEETTYVVQPGDGWMGYVFNKTGG